MFNDSSKGIETPYIHHFKTFQSTERSLSEAGERLVHSHPLKKKGTDSIAPAPWLSPFDTDGLQTGRVAESKSSLWCKDLGMFLDFLDFQILFLDFDQAFSRIAIGRRRRRRRLVASRHENAVFFSLVAPSKRADGFPETMVLPCSGQCCKVDLGGDSFRSATHFWRRSTAQRAARFTVSFSKRTRNGKAKHGSLKEVLGPSETEQMCVPPRRPDGRPLNGLSVRWAAHPSLGWQRGVGRRSSENALKEPIL